MILKVHLHYLVRQAEHDSMLSSHPFLNVHMRVYLERFTFLARCAVCAGEMLLVLHPCDAAFFVPVVVILQVRSKMLHQSHLLVQFFGVAGYIVHLHHVLLLGGRYRLSFIVIKCGLRGLVEEDLGRIVEEDPCRPV